MLHEVVGVQDDAHLVRFTSCTHARTLVNKRISIFRQLM